MKLKTVTLRGYKSIAKLEAFELRNLNVLIGADGTIPADPVCGSAEVLRLIDAIEEAVAHNRTGSPVLPGASTDVL